MKNLISLLTCVFSIAAFGQETTPAFDGKNWKPPYTLSTPQGWDVERFLLPPFFAPAITYKGVEDIRFTPGWANVKTDEYWSYTFLWYLDGFPEMKEKIIQENLEAYYTGLIKINMDPQKIPAGGIPATKVSIQKVKKATGDSKTYSGTIEMLDYMQQKTIVLNCRIHFKPYKGKNKTIVFYELSPKPFSDQVWTALHKLWSDFQYN